MAVLEVSSISKVQFSNLVTPFNSRTSEVNKCVGVFGQKSCMPRSLFRGFKASMNKLILPIRSQTRYSPTSASLGLIRQGQRELTVTRFSIGKAFMSFLSLSEMLTNVPFPSPTTVPYPDQALSLKFCMRRNQHVLTVMRGPSLTAQSNS